MRPCMRAASGGAMPKPRLHTGPIMAITPQEALLRCIEHREIFHDEMLHLMRLIMRGELSPVMTAAIVTGLDKEILSFVVGNGWFDWQLQFEDAIR